MISKRLTNDQFADQLPSTLLHIFSRGLDQSQLQKMAASPDLAAFGGKVKPEPGHSFIHLITLGAGERYGSNTWADYFNKTARCHTSPGMGTAQLADGLSKHHRSFMEHGAVYRNHHNATKGGTPKGEIVWEGLNDRMDRGEVVIKVANDAWHVELDKIARGEPVFWSMGCGCPDDMCSYCLNRAPNRTKYCDHLKFQKHAIMDNGVQVSALTDRPIFHDISEVPTPADRIANHLAKVAAAGHYVPLEEDQGLYVPLSVMRQVLGNKARIRVDVVEKVAASQEMASVGQIPPLDPVDEAEIVAGLSKYAFTDVMVELKNAHIVLPPRTFARILLGNKTDSIAGLEKMADAVGEVYSQLRNGIGSQEILEDGSYFPTQTLPSAPGVVREVRKHQQKLALSPEAIARRVAAFELSPAEHQKTASAPSPEVQCLAREYVKYQLSVLSGIDSPDDRERCCRMAGRLS